MGRDPILQARQGAYITGQESWEGTSLSSRRPGQSLNKGTGDTEAPEWSGQGRAVPGAARVGFSKHSLKAQEG